jgi:ribose transport system ATP-binding protein
MRGVAKRFGAVQALDGVDLEVRAGEVHALVGENGAGKSTLMKVLAGAHAPDAGTMALFGEPYSPEGPLAARRAGVAMIYQELNLARHLSVEENVMLGRERTQWGVVRRRAMRTEVEQALAFLGHSDIPPRTRVADLGPGRRQVVEIARALAGEARILVLDEPTSSLSHADAERLFEVLARLRARGVAIVYISHFLEEVKRVADRYTVLRDGKSVASGDIQGVGIETILRHMAGREMTDFFPRVPHEQGEVVLDVSALAGEELPREASLVLHRGEIFGIAGLVGAGRTELLRALFGLDPIRRGVVRLAGHVHPHSGPRENLRRGMGLLSENRKEEGLALSRPIAENMTLSRLEPFLKLGRIDRAAQRRACTMWMERLRIRSRGAEHPCGELSGGNQQKVALARLLHHDVDVLLLDEPTRGIDVASKVEIYRWMGELARAGKAILMVSSYLPELLGVCDRIAVMHRGKLGAARPTSAWNETSILDEATRGGT